MTPFLLSSPVRSARQSDWPLQNGLAGEGVAPRDDEGTQGPSSGKSGGEEIGLGSEVSAGRPLLAGEGGLVRRRGRGDALRLIPARSGAPRVAAGRDQGDDRQGAGKEENSSHGDLRCHGEGGLLDLRDRRSGGRSGHDPVPRIGPGEPRSPGGREAGRDRMGRRKSKGINRSRR